MTPEAQRFLDEQWQRLIEYLNTWCSVTSATPGRIEVQLTAPHGSGREAIIVMTPDEWDDITGVMWGNFDDAANDVRQTLLRLAPHEQFAVYSQYRLEPSIVPTLPERPKRTPPPGGTWVAYDRDGRVASRFADWSEPDESP
jgi:hypothetical protein